MGRTITIMSINIGTKGGDMDKFIVGFITGVVAMSFAIAYYDVWSAWLP